MMFPKGKVEMSAHFYFHHIRVNFVPMQALIMYRIAWFEEINRTFEE